MYNYKKRTIRGAPILNGGGGGCVYIYIYTHTISILLYTDKSKTLNLKYCAITNIIKIYGASLAVI